MSIYDKFLIAIIVLPLLLVFSTAVSFKLARDIQQTTIAAIVCGCKKEVLTFPKKKQQKSSKNKSSGKQLHKFPRKKQNASQID